KHGKLFFHADLFFFRLLLWSVTFLLNFSWLCKSITLHRQTDSLARNIHFNDCDIYLLLNRNCFIRIFDKLIAKVTDVNQSILVDAYINECSECRYIRNNTGELHADLQITDGMDPFREAEEFELLSRVATWFFQFSENIGKRW